MNKWIFIPLLLTSMVGPIEARDIETLPDASTPGAFNETPVAIVPEVDTIPEQLIELGQGKLFSSHAFVVDKERRTLTIWKREGHDIDLVAAHPIDYGKIEGDKQISGDKKTPEGIYFFLKELSGSELNFEEYGSFAYTMDYPNHFDRLADKTGYGIWLHGIPDSKSLKRGSRGCVVLRNNIIQTVHKYISLNQTPIIVSKKITYVPKTMRPSAKDSINRWLNSWITSWETKDINLYMSHYADNFKSHQFNKRRWKRYKEALNEKYQFIKVSIERPLIIRNDSQYIVQFIQSYQSDKLTDIGQKTLYLKQEADGKLKITGEEWASLPSNLLAHLQTKENKPTEN